MSLAENMKMALSSLLAHKMRSILTMIGIIIGVGSVITVVAIGQGGEAMLKSQIIGEGNTVELMYMPSEEEMIANPNAMMAAPFTQEDIRAIEEIPEVSKVVATSSEFGSVRFRENTLDASITGINQSYLDVNGLKMASGRNLLAADFLGGRRVVVVSSTFQEELFEGENPIGQVIFIRSNLLKLSVCLKNQLDCLHLGPMKYTCPGIRGERFLPPMI